MSSCPTNKKIFPLHSHTAYSLLDGVSDVSEYIKYCKENEISACSCTDHGYVMGLYDLITQSQENDILGIPGVEVYLHPGEGYVAASGKKPPRYFHLTLWAMNQTGYKTILELSNSSWQAGRVVTTFGHKKPRVTWEDLEESNEGLICGSGCILGPVTFPYLRGEREMANKNLYRLMEIFGDRLYFEVMPHRVDRDWTHKDVIQVDSTTGVTYTFKSTDILETPDGNMTAAEAMKQNVTEILGSVTQRPQPRGFSDREVQL